MQPTVAIATLFAILLPAMVAASPAAKPKTTSTKPTTTPTPQAPAPVCNFSSGLDVSRLIADGHVISTSTGGTAADCKDDCQNFFAGCASYSFGLGGNGVNICHAYTINTQTIKDNYTGLSVVFAVKDKACA